MQKIEPCLAKLSDIIPAGKNWLFEIKYDGYRILAFKENGNVRLMTRNNFDYSDKFESIIKSLKEISGDYILDGEIAVADEQGRTDFSALKNSLREKKNNFSYIIFDLLWQNGKDLRQFPLVERKKLLTEILKNVPENLFESKFVAGKGKECFAAAQEMELEGIIAKKADSIYGGGRNGDWLKIKCYRRQEFVVGGYTTSDKNQTLAAVLLGYYDKDKLIYIGKAGTGFTEKIKSELENEFVKLESEKSFFVNTPKDKNVVWLNPKLIAEIQFAEITKDKLLRQASFKDLRSDKNPKDVVLEYHG